MNRGPGKKKRKRFYSREKERQGGSMPKRWIEFPSETNPLLNPITNDILMDKETGKPVTLDMKEVMAGLMSHPLWNDGLDQAEAQDSILRAFDEAQKAKISGMWLAEADWRYLEAAAKNPKLALPNGMVQNGLGRLPFMARVYVPYLKAVTGAKTEAEKEKADREAEKAKKTQPPETVAG
jgi:hypothetical protein